MKIAIDAGHYINTAGKRTPDGIREWTLNDAVADYLASYLKGYADTFRVDDATGKTAISIDTRRNNAVKKGADLLVSIHHNAYNGKWNDATGVEVYRHTLFSHKQAKELATKLASAISKETGLRNRGAKKALFAVIGTSKIPCVLCEGGFMDGRNDSKYIRTAAGQKAYAKAIANTIISYYGLKKASNKKETETKTYSNGAESFDSKYRNGKTYKTTANLHLRKGASTKDTSLCVMPKGTKVTWYGYYTGSWKYVKVTTGKYKGKVGFCSQKYLK